MILLKEIMYMSKFPNMVSLKRQQVHFYTFFTITLLKEIFYMSVT